MWGPLQWILPLSLLSPPCAVVKRRVKKPTPWESPVSFGISSFTDRTRRKRGKLSLEKYRQSQLFRSLSFYVCCFLLLTTCVWFCRRTAVRAVLTMRRRQENHHGARQVDEDAVRLLLCGVSAMHCIVAARRFVYFQPFGETGGQGANCWETLSEFTVVPCWSSPKFCALVWANRENRMCIKRAVANFLLN